MRVEPPQNRQLLLRTPEDVGPGHGVEPAVHQSSLLVSVSLVEFGAEEATEVAGDVCNASDRSLVVSRHHHRGLRTQGGYVCVGVVREGTII